VKNLRIPTVSDGAARLPHWLLSFVRANYMSSFFETVFAVLLVLKFRLVSWQLNGKVKVWDNFGFCSVVHRMDGDNYLLSRVTCSPSDAPHAVYPHPPTPAYRTYRCYTGIKGIAPIAQLKDRAHKDAKFPLIHTNTQRQQVHCKHCMS